MLTKLHSFSAHEKDTEKIWLWCLIFTGLNLVSDSLYMHLDCKNKRGKTHCNVYLAVKIWYGSISPWSINSIYLDFNTSHNITNCCDTANRWLFFYSYLLYRNCILYISHIWSYHSLWGFSSKLMLPLKNIRAWLFSFSSNIETVFLTIVLTC